MNQSNDILEPRLVAVDSYYLSFIDERIQDLSNSAEILSYALNTIEANDPASKGVICAVQAALLSNSELAAELSEQMGVLILQPRIEVNTYE